MQIATPTAADLGDGRVRLAFTCMMCQQAATLTVDKNRYSAWLSGQFNVQDIFPDLTPAERETLLTGMHDACFDQACPPGDMDDDAALPYLPEVKDEDLPLLHETWRAIQADASSVPRNPVWGRDYDPLAILTNPNSYPEHIVIALVNVRIAMNPEESWGKCANCGEIYRHGSDTVCSEPCFNAFLRSM